MKQLAHATWFPIMDLVLAGSSAVLWYVGRGIVSWQPLLLALCPWLIRWRAGEPPWRRTPFDWPLVLFVATAVMGLWAAYDRGLAGQKWWLIVAAVFLYYALAGQPRRFWWIGAGGLGLVGTAVAVYFLLTHNWQTWPTDFPWLTQIGTAWMQKRPLVTASPLHPNLAGGLMALCLPLLLVTTWQAGQRRHLLVAGLLAAAGLVLGSGLLLSSSRGAWLALSAVGGLALLWQVSQWLKRLLPLPSQTIFLSILVLLMSLTLLGLATRSDEALPLAALLPGIQNSYSRAELVHHTSDLIGDFFFTGGGLAAFAGLYSQYIINIPHFVFSYSHNFYLDVWLEQGILGFITMMWLLIGSVILLTRRLAAGTEAKRLAQAILAALIILMLHGWIDDAVYGGVGTPLLFALPGMAVAVSGAAAVQASQTPAWQRRQMVWGAAGAALLLIAGGLIYHRPLLANWYANLGAVEMAQVQLAHWPTGEWDEGQNVAALNRASGLLQQAATLDPHNRTAHYYLGRVAMVEREYDTAVTHLETAYKRDAAHRGIIKSLGYAYVWSGNLEQAAALLSAIPETLDEMTVYTWWWRSQNREDLAVQAEQMVVQLQSNPAQG